MEYDDDECPFIPFSGEDVGIHDPTRTAPWIHDEDKIACILAVAIYGNPPPVIQSYELVIGTYKTRFAAWIDKQTRLLIVACRGTSIGMKGGFQDIKDDTVIAREGTDYCALTLVNDVKQMMGTLEGGYDSVLFTGHSLGGTSAFCLAKAFQNSRCVVFNPGAAPTNPILAGPGPERAVVYHIVGDIISTHMSPKAALVHRVKLNVPFGSVKAHGTENFFSSGSYSYVTPTTEDELFLKWAKSFSITGAIYARYSKYLQSQIKYNPIPGSHRDLYPEEFDAKGAKKSRYAVVNSVKSFIYKNKLV